MELTSVLALPLFGSLVLAIFGHRARAAEINSGFSLATLIAAIALTVKVVDHGPMLAHGDQFFTDAPVVVLPAASTR